MKVLHVMSSLDPVDRTNVSIVERLRSRGIETTIIGPCTGPLRTHPDIVPTLKKLYEDADIVHLHGLWEDVHHQASRLAFERGLPYVLRPRGLISRWSMAQGTLKKKLYLFWRLKKDLDRAAAMHYTSAVERDEALPLKIQSPSIVEPNGVELKDYLNYQTDGHFRKQLMLRDDQMLLIFFSRIHPKRGLDLLVPAFAKVREALGDRVILAIAGMGDESYLKSIKGLVKHHQLSEAVHFVGMLQGKESLAALGEADLFVLPSYQENFGNAVTESLAAGIPVVITDQVNIHSLLSRGGVGGVTTTDVDSISYELIRWLQDSELRHAAASRARAFVAQHFDWNSIAVHWGQRYTSLSKK